MTDQVGLVRRTYLRLFRPDELHAFERKIYSQNGEDGLIEEIFTRVGTESKFAVEFGVEDGKECNTRYLKDKKGWKVLQTDGNKRGPASIKKEFITVENVNGIFEKYKVPYNLDLLSIDIDSNDLWVWKALNTRYRPRLVVVEYNATIAPCYAQSVKLDNARGWDGSNYFGASLLALYRLARTRGYSLVACNLRGVNAFFVRDDLLSRKLVAKLPADAYQPPRFGQEAEPGIFIGHRPPSNAFVDVNENVDVA